MSFIQCLSGMIDEGVISEKQFEELADRFEELVEELQASGSANAEAQAQKLLALKLNSDRKNLLATVRQTLKTEELVHNIESSVALAKAEYDKLNKAQRFFFAEPTTARLYQDTLQQAYTRGQSLSEQYMGKLSGLAPEGDMKPLQAMMSDAGKVADMYRLLRGGVVDGVDPVVAKAAKIFRQVLDDQNAVLRNAGADLGYVDNYTPQVHNAPAIEKLGFDNWSALLRNVLDMTKLVDSNGVPLSPQGFTDAARVVYKEITEGLNHASVEGRADLNMRRAHARFFHYKDGDSFIKYNDQAGVKDDGLWDIMVHHVQRNAQDIGTMEVMGPKARDLQKHMESEVYGSRTAGAHNAKAMYTQLMGDTGYNSDGAIVQLFEGTKNLLRASLLGSATISALPDLVLSGVVAKMNGLPGFDGLQKYLSSAALAEERAFVSNQAHILEITTHGMTVNRFADGGSQYTRGLMKKAADLTHRISLLQSVTRSLADSSSLALAGETAVLAAKRTPWGGLSKAFREAASKHGITEGDWSKVINMPAMDGRLGSQFMPWSSIKTVDASIGQKFADWDHSLRAQVTNVPDLWMAALSSGRVISPDSGGMGSWAHGLSSAGLLFKSYPIQVVRNVTLPLFRQAITGDTSAQGQLAVLIAGTATLGYATLQLKQLIKNREPLELNGATAARALWQAGTFGLAGDFVFQDQSGYGRSPLQDLMLGPMAGAATTNFQALQRNAIRLFDGEDTKLASELINANKAYLPVANVFYLKPFTQAMLSGFDDLVSPDSAGRRAKRFKLQQKDTGAGQIYDNDYY